MKLSLTTIVPPRSGPLLLVLGTSVLLGSTGYCVPPPKPAVHHLLDVSGMAWIGGDQFLAVHDSKNTKEKRNWPRVSRITLPRSEIEGVRWEVLKLAFRGPALRPGDLESACRLPAGKGFILCESGQEGAGDRHLYHAVPGERQLDIVAHTRWPVVIRNVEATEVCTVGDQLVFLYAERADSQPATQLRWATMKLNPWTFGEFREVKYRGVAPVGKGARPIVGLDVDSAGWIYIVSAQDPGTDDGPYRSVVWRIGRIAADSEGVPVVELGESKRIATLDGLKVESVCIRPAPNGRKQVFVGTDDEHYGGIIRPLP